MSDGRQRVASGTPWETIVGFSRAVRVDRFVYVAGTTATDERGAPVGIGDVAAQTDYIIRKIERALAETGATLADVVRTRIYVRAADDWEEVGRVHGTYFSAIRPANTLVEVSRLVGDEYLVEIEADAVIGEDGPHPPAPSPARRGGVEEGSSVSVPAPPLLAGEGAGG